MLANEWFQAAIFFSLIIALTPPLGAFIAKVAEGRPTFLHRVLGPAERLGYRLSGVNQNEDMAWLGYFWAVLLFNVLGIVTLWGLQMFQAGLPLNPQKFDNVGWALAL